MRQSTGELRDRVAIVTGASSGIGAAVCRTLAADGAAVVLAARRIERLDALRAGIEEAGGRALAVPTDVTDRDAVRTLVDRALEAFGRIDILVNNAGAMLLSPLRARRVEEWERMIDLNVKGVLLAVAAVLPAMLRQGGGHIVNLGSLAGRRPFPGGVVYSATKFAVRSISAGIRLELSPDDRIRVTDVEPGVVATELFDHIADEEMRNRFLERWEGRRMLDPDDVARAVRYALTQPAHVNVNELLVRPTDQQT